MPEVPRADPAFSRHSLSGGVLPEVRDKDVAGRVTAPYALETESFRPGGVVVKPLTGRRIVICGKGGSGKSTLTALFSVALESSGYDVVLVDGDASNPGGLSRLVAGEGSTPLSLLDYFGGRKNVSCPVDDPSPLVRLSDHLPVEESPIDPLEIPSSYRVQKGRRVLFQVGKIVRACEGCDGPMSKVTRDFIVAGPYVTIIDVEAGVEHFGRGVEKHVDVVLLAVDPSFESFEVAARVTELSTHLGVPLVRAIINNVSSRLIEQRMRSALDTRHVPILGTVWEDPLVQNAGLEGSPLGACRALDDAVMCLRELEKSCANQH